MNVGRSMELLKDIILKANAAKSFLVPSDLRYGFALELFESKNCSSSVSIVTVSWETGV
jgi:hypothetical protein